MNHALSTALPVAQVFNPEYLTYHRLLPLDLVDGVLRVAVSGNPCPEVLDDLRDSYSADLELVSTAEPELLAAIRTAFAAQESVVAMARDLEGATELADLSEDRGLTDVRHLANEPPVIRFVNLLIREGYAAGASDIHLEAGRDGLRVRLRVDGALSDIGTPPKALQAAIASRVKLLAELDIAERRAPQDGRIRVRLEDRELDLRVSTVPTMFGESVVLRLLDRGGQPIDLEQLGMGAATLVEFRRLVAKPHGIVLATGPTGSGKTTTLYAALRLRHGETEKIITVEDPVEYHLAGVTQVPIHGQAGVTFATALRSLLRQDPDVMMIGETRDPETARIAVQAAMTGHLLFTTLHTNDAVSALARLVDLDIEPYMVAATVEGVLAQRLVRRICPICVEVDEPTGPDAAWLDQHRIDPSFLRRGRGCNQCRHTGFRGRVGIFELLVVTDELRELIVREFDIGKIRAAARDAGMRSLRADGLAKVTNGVTTLAEVVRVTTD